jgi:hypothetical protein
MNYDAFSHGQIKSKLWLLENLEFLMDYKSSIAILGAWYNILGFMMMVRRPKHYKEIVGYDINPEVKNTADKINNAFTFDPAVLGNETKDANQIVYRGVDVVINCSPEHFDNDEWFNKIPFGTVVAIQSSDMTETGDPWFIKQPNPDIESFRSRYHLSKVYVCDTMRIQYDDWGYNRFMLIGIK